MPLKNGNIDYGYEYLGIHSIQETDPMATTIGGGQVEEELEERTASKANSIPKPVQTYDKDNNLVRHGGILDCLFTPAATKKKEQAGYMDLLSKIDEQIKENNKIQNPTDKKAKAGLKANQRFASVGDPKNSSPTSVVKASQLKKRNPSAITTAPKQVSTKANHPLSISFEKSVTQGSIFDNMEQS